MKADEETVGRVLAEAAERLTMPDVLQCPNIVTRLVFPSRKPSQSKAKCNRSGLMHRSSRITFFGLMESTQG